VVAAVDITGALVSSAVVAAVVAAASTFITQRYLLDRKARVDYEYMARKRLYDAIGPLRMHLLFAARDVVRRVGPHAEGKWDMNPTDHFVRSFIYRLLRPLAVGQLIERQLSFADFSVDASAVALLRFHTAAERMLSGDDVVLGHPSADWTAQTQHLFRDNLRVAAARLISDDDGVPSVLDYARFQEATPDPTADPALRAPALIFAGCKYSLTENPIFWLRVVGYAYACNRLLAAQGVSVGFEDATLPTEEMLAAVDDDRIAGRAADYVHGFETILAQGL
jgi:hypothetical protein